MLLTMTAPCADRFANFDGFCRDPQTPVSDGPRCEGRSAFRPATSAAHAARCGRPAVIVLQCLRRWSPGNLKAAIEAALGGKQAYRNRIDAEDTAYRRASHEERCGMRLQAEKPTSWITMRAGVVTFRARFVSRRTAVLGNRYTEIEWITADGGSPILHTLAQQANG